MRSPRRSRMPLPPPPPPPRRMMTGGRGDGGKARLASGGTTPSGGWSTGREQPPKRARCGGGRRAPAKRGRTDAHRADRHEKPLPEHAAATAPPATTVSQPQRCSDGRCGVVRPDDETRAKTAPRQAGRARRRGKRPQNNRRRQGRRRARARARLQQSAWCAAGSEPRAREQRTGATAADQIWPPVVSLTGRGRRGSGGGCGSRRRRQRSPRARCVTPARQIGRVRVWPPSRGVGRWTTGAPHPISPPQPPEVARKCIRTNCCCGVGVFKMSS